MEECPCAISIACAPAPMIAAKAGRINVNEVSMYVRICVYVCVPVLLSQRWQLM
jgi:hypothetical protein